MKRPMEEYDMDDIESMNLRDKHTQRRRMLLLCAVALLINVAGDRLVGLLKLPLYLDNIGSALAAALGGYIPGIVVGFFTNLITGLRDYNNTYFGSLTVLIAISSAWFARRGYYDKPWKLPVIAITFALIGGGLGSVLSWTLYGFDFGIGVSAPLARRLFAMGKFSQFWAQFTADMLLDLADKAITVSIVAVVLNQMPQKLRQKMFFAGWQQTPLSGKTLKAADGRPPPSTSRCSWPRAWSTWWPRPSTRTGWTSSYGTARPPPAMWRSTGRWGIW